MLYRDFYPFYAAQGNPVFYNEEREQEREFDLMRSGYSQKDSGEGGSTVSASGL